MTTTSSTTSSASSSNGLLTALGLGSGLDIESLVTELTTAEMSAANSRVTREQTAVDTQVSAVATLKSSLATFQSALTTLNSGTGFSAVSATSSDESVFTAEVDSTAATGTYEVVVTQLAQQHQILSGAFTDSDTTSVGTGTLSFTVGDNSFSVDISSGSSTLQDIADAINYAGSNAYVSATIINGTGGPQLLLSSLYSGADNEITVAVSDATGDLDTLAYSSSSTANYTETQEAQDAIISVAGVEYQGSSNEISGVLDGVTINLEEADPDTTLTLKIAHDTSHLESLVNSFVTAYNTLMTSLATLDSYDSSTGETGALFGDALLGNVRNQVRNAISSAVSSISGTYSSLAAIGIKTDADGFLTVDDTKLAVAVSANFADVSSIFDADDGLMARLSTALEGALDSGGTIAARNDTLTTRQEHIDADNEAIELRTAKIQERFLAKFNAMDSLLATLQNTSDYLTQMFDSLNNSNS